MRVSLVVPLVANADASRMLTMAAVDSRSVSDLREQVSRWHGNAYYREELKKWTQRRIYYGGVEPPPDKRALDANGEQDLQIGDSGEVDLANEGRASAAKKRKIATTKKGKGKGKTKGKNTQGDEADDLDEDDFVLDEEVRKLTEEAAGKELAILEYASPTLPSLPRHA